MTKLRRVVSAFSVLTGGKPHELHKNKAFSVHSLRVQVGLGCLGYLCVATNDLTCTRPATAVHPRQICVLSAYGPRRGVFLRLKSLRGAVVAVSRFQTFEPTDLPGLTRTTEASVVEGAPTLFLLSDGEKSCI